MLIIHNYFGAGCSELRQTLEEMEKRIVMTQKEAVDSINALNVTLQKVVVEETKLIDTIAELKAELDNTGNVSEELANAINAVVLQSKVLDDVVPDTADIPAPIPTP